MSSAENHPAASRFPTTAWSMVAKAGDCHILEYQESLARLCGSYWQPVYAFIQRKGFDLEEARDCTQEFFTRVIEKEYLRDVDRSKGKFRSFVLVAVSHFLSNHLDSLRAQKRGGGRDPVSLDGDDTETRRACEPAHDSTPEALFEYQWALTVLECALDRLRTEYSSTDFFRLKPFLLGDAAHGQLAAAARQLATSEGSLKLAVHRMRKRFREKLRAEIANTVSDPALVDEEIRYLVAVLARGGELRQM
jgi:DNA-directed RNA polymerase specialized sigma24 family protein